MNNFELKLRRRNIPESELIEDIQRVANKLNKITITKVDYDLHGHFGATTMLRKFGTWNKALNTCGLSLTNRINIPEEELFENVANIWQALGRQPTGKDLSKALGVSQFSLGTYEKRFKSWNNALLAFVDYIKKPNADTSEISISLKDPSNNQQKRTAKKINWRLRATILIRDSCICQMCGASPSKDSSVTLHIDHIKPWTKGGETVIENLQTLCSVCNIGKSNVL
jgi:hypothetical protein